jgi:GNAT superfamily N-acetyltransferase
MAHEALDNPFWSSLRTRHRDVALFADDVSRYPPEYAPFLGVSSADADVGEALRALVAEDETVYLLGVLPQVPDGWHCEAFRPLAQMTCDAPLPVANGPEAIRLDESHRADAIALTRLVYPHYFRQRTMELGRYFGIYLGGTLAAMAGERLGTDDTRELSAICTHPDFTGRGYARRLTALLANDNLERGCLPFLHVSHENTRALAMYAKLGFRHRADIGFWSLRPG